MAKVAELADAAYKTECIADSDIMQVQVLPFARRKDSVGERKPA